MKLEGQQHLKSSVDGVWQALDGTEAYGACMPAITRLEAISPTRREATIDLQLPAISGVFEGSIDILEREAPQRVLLKIEGSGKTGVIDGTAEIRLAELGEGTAVNYNADVQVGGQIARLGQRMIGAATREMAAEFFGNLDRYLATGEEVTVGGPMARLAGLFALLLRSIRGLFSPSR